MIKKILLAIALSALLSAKTVMGLNQSMNKNIAVENAHWSCFEQALKDIAGQQSYIGNVKKDFRKDFEKDFIGFQTKYFEFSTHKCEERGEDGFVCQVNANINVEKIRAFMSQKANSSKTMGKNRMGNLKIALVDNLDTDSSKDFVTFIQSSLNDSGHSLFVLPKGSLVGSKGNKCKAIEEQYNTYKKKGNSYKSAVKAAKKKLDECKENKDVQYSFELEKIDLDLAGKTTSNEVQGSLNYRIHMLNTQTGKRDYAIKSSLIRSVAQNEKALKFKLFEIGGKNVSKEITSNILNSITKKEDTKKFSKFNKNEYMYTVIMRGLTNDRGDRAKIKIVKDTVASVGVKLRKNRSESTDFEQVYNFGSDEEIDIENLKYELYDLADSIEIPIQVTDESDTILTVQFQ
ncbi:MAG: hypothetical protein U9P71_02660 [Campylobacterota bacterium]|nr:hypothetical protein [Campylobacterota bacterium]